MKQEKIHYRDIMDLGFNEEICSDSVFFDEFGFDYTIITFKITNKVYLDWDKVTQLCELVRIDSPKTCNIKKKMKIMNLNELKKVLEFFSNKENETFDPAMFA